MSGPYVEQTAEPATAELEESLSRMINTLQARLSWATAGACVRDIAPEVAALVAAAEERGAAKERERCAEHLQRLLSLSATSEVDKMAWLAELVAAWHRGDPE